MADIRGFFKPKGGSGTNGTALKTQVKSKETDNAKRKKKNVISDSSEEDEPTPKPAKKSSKQMDSDDDFESKKNGSNEKKAKKSPTLKKSSPPKLKAVNATDFFGSKPKLQTPASACGLVKPSFPPSASQKHLSNDSPAKKRKSSEDAKAEMDEKDRLFKKTCDETDFSNPSKKMRHDDSTKSLSEKLAAKMKSKTVEKSHEFKTENGTKEATTKTVEKSHHFSASNGEKKLINTPESKKKSPKLDESVADESMNDSIIPGTPQEAHEEKRQEKQAAYKKFLSRGGAKNPGSKPIPDGSANCLAGLVFVLTGVYESLERETMAGIIKEYGGKVTTSLSKNTKYIVIGDEAGASKLEKAEKLGTEKLTEDGFLELIRKRSEGKVKNEKKSPEKSPSKTTKKEKSPVKASSESVKIASDSTKKQVNGDTNNLLKKSSSPEFKSSIKIPKIAKEDPPQEPSTSSSSKAVEKCPSTGTYGTGHTELWVDKYKPSAAKGIIGQQGDRSNMNKLKIWLKDWNKNHLESTKAAPKPAPWGVANDNGAWAKCALLSGPPGVGKTTTAYLVSKELGYDVVEMNASDTRSKKLLQTSVSDTLNTTSVATLMGDNNANNKVTSKRVLLMDEVDGMAGNEDRGGIAEIIILLKTSKIPIIAMCNDRNHQKIRSLANHCFDLRFARPRVEQIKAAMMSVCFKEKVPIKPDALTELIVGCGQDVRQVLHHLSMIRASDSGDKMDAATAKKEADISKKTSVKVGPWDVCKKVFNGEDHKKMSLYDKSDLYFHDYNMAGLFVQENYLSATPQAARGNKRKTMELVSKAADSISEGDLVEKRVRSGMNWGLLPTAATFCSVLPGEYMSGFMHGQIQFPAWLGKNSKRSKIDRILQELQMHTRLTAGASKTNFNLDYSQVLRDHVVGPLVASGGEGINDSVAIMENYHLLREDLDGLLEVAQWPDRPDPMKKIETKTKTAFTRKYNKDAAALPYSVGQTVSKKSSAGTGDMMGMDEEEGDGNDEEEDDSVGNDAMIKAKKPVAKAKSENKGSAKGSKGGGKGSKKGK